ncbi:MAG: MogA/MoaB family molybdenum cofactor biosynthesis protein [Chloroflexota bacterium]
MDEHDHDHGSPIAALVLTVSDGVAAGVREDTGGAGLAERVAAAGYAVRRAAVADEPALIVQAIQGAALDGVRLVVSTGGTGLGPRDRTPEAIRSIASMEIPGYGEAMRAAGRRFTPLADLSRSLAVAVGDVLVIAVPGSPKGALESFDAVAPILEHTLDILAGYTQHRPA